MSDFLGRLAARTLGVAQAAQPMGRAMFAQGDRWEKSGGEQEAFSEISETAEAGEKVEASSGRSVSPLSAGRTDAAPAAETTGRQTNPWSSAEFPAAAPVIKSALSDLATETNVLGARARGHRDPEPQIQRAPLAADGIQVAARPAPDAAGGVAESRHEISGAQLLVPRKSTLPQSDQAHFESGAAARERSSTRASAPVIRVSIGRVEVRAEFPAPAARPAAHRTQPSPLSLEEYARQRQEGKR